MNNKKTLEMYNQNANNYMITNQNNQEINKYRNIFINNLNGSQLLDIGCGTGRDVNFFQEKGLSVIGYDGSVGMLEQAKILYPNSHFIHLNLLDKNWFIDNKYNGIWACASLLHFEEKEFKKIFVKLIKLLDKNGLFYFSVKIKDTMYNETIDNRWFQYYTKEYLDNFIETLDGTILYYEENIKENKDVFANYFINF